MSEVSSSEVQSRKSATDEVADFRDGLHELYNRAGRPSKSEMAKKAGRPVSLFGFLETTTLPTWDEVSTFLVAVEQKNAVIEKYRCTHRRLERQLEGDRADTAARSGPTLSSAAVTVVINLDTEVRALTDAKAAWSAADFSAALDRLRSTARVPGKDEAVSFLDLEKASGGRLSKSTAHRLTKLTKLPSRTVNVERYVRACGATEEHVRLWVDEYQRLKRGEPPEIAQHAMPADSSGGVEHPASRSNGVLSGLTDTDAFTAIGLGLDGRKLIMFVSAAIVDDTGSAETAYRGILRRWGNTRDHWAFGMDLRQLDDHLSQYVGRTARIVPLWPTIRDLVEAAIHEPDARTQVLADAAGLYSQVAGCLPDGYDGITHLPWWGYQVTGHTQLETVLLSLPTAGRRLTDAELEVMVLREEAASTRQALDTAIRGFRTLAARESELAGREGRLHAREARLDAREARLDAREARTLSSPATTVFSVPLTLPLLEASGS